MYRLINLNGRACLDVGGHAVDLGRLAGDEGLSDPMAAVARFRELGDLVPRASDVDGVSFHVDQLHAPVPRPRQVFGIGLNYRAHALETNKPLPPAPLTFTKFPSCITGPTATIPVHNDTVDYEIELVVVIGDECRNVSESAAWSHVAGLTLGQDVSDRTLQYEGTPPQFSLGKSHERFGPTGPAVVAPSELSNPDDIELICELNGTRVQHARTSDLIFSVPELVSYLTRIVTLYPGDLIFTGTPAGVGAATGRFLADGDVLTSFAEGIGDLRNACAATSA